MPRILYKSVPFSKDDVTLALESGVDGLVVPAEHMGDVASLARCLVLDAADMADIDLGTKEDEEQAKACIHRGQAVLLAHGWEIIPVENLLACEEGAGKAGLVALEVRSADEAALAWGILERGVETVVVTAAGLSALKAVVGRVRNERHAVQLHEAVITEVTPVGLGHRVCVDTLTLLRSGQGMLVGNSAAFMFLINAETEPNEFVAPRPFRVNAGAVHAYAMLPGDTTRYLEELRTGTEVLIVDAEGNTEIAVAGRLKVERRPMLLIRARCGAEEGTVFLQNAETIRLVQPGGATASVVELAAGDRILCRLDKAGRHFGMRISEDIAEQ